MKMIFVVFVSEQDGKYQAIPDTIRTGENILSHCQRYKAITCHLCETRGQAEKIAVAWNEEYKRNNKNLY